MRASELRIGNLVQDENGNIYIAETISEPGLAEESSYKAVNGGSYVYSFDKLQPIPLTEEWLLKFGFEYIEEDELWYYEGFKLWQSDKNEFYHLNSELYLCPDSVHELQNLYFALTGTELTIK